MARKLGIAMVVVLLVVIGLVCRRDHSPPTARSSAVKASAVKMSAVAPSARGPARPNAWRDDTPAGGLRLEGQVVDRDGKGVAGAKVALAITPPREVVAEADGSFAFDQLAAGGYQLEAASGDQIGGSVSYQLAEHSDPVVIRLGAASAVIVSVVDEADRPIAGAEVHVARGALDRRIATDAQGIAKIAPVQPSALDLEVSAPGCGLVLARANVGSPNTTVEIRVTLRRGFAISGRVVDDAAQPIAGARVTPFTAEYDRLDGAAVTSDARGEFTTAALAPGRYTLLARDGEHHPTRSALVAVIAQAAGPLAIVMKAGGVITGAVVDPEHRPIASAGVTVASRDPEVGGYRRVIADASGHFEIRGLARGKLAVSGDANDARGAPVEVDLTAHPQAELELVLDQRGTIAGVVVDDHGAPAPEVQVSLWRGRMAEGKRLTTTDGDGKFVIRGLEDGEYRLAAVWRPGAPLAYSTAQDFGTAAHTGDASVRLVLATPGTVIGKIVVAGASAPPVQVMVMLGQHMTMAARDGTFRIEEAEPGTWDLHAHSQDFSDLQRGGVVVTGGATLDLGTITVSRGRTITGRVVDAAGAPAVGATVRIDPDFQTGPDAPAFDFEHIQPAREAKVARDGRFLVVGLWPTATKITAEDPARGRSASLAIPAGKEDPPPVVLTFK